MKTKLIFSFLAIVFAAGSAFTSRSANEEILTPVYVKLQQVQGGAITCREYDGTCNELGSASCKVTVATQQGSKIVNAHPDSNCGMTLNDSRASIGTFSPSPTPWDAFN